MDSLLLSCRALASPTTCRFIPALSGLPVNRPQSESLATALFPDSSFRVSDHGQDEVVNFRELLSPPVPRSFMDTFGMKPDARFSFHNQRGPASHCVLMRLHSRNFWLSNCPFYIVNLILRGRL
ncbi:MAG: hypothetical protein QOJ42_1983 [Acidobacteriaceae bacterium]|nr:hypothetical protein [Acidobacteriaceae bacterium]